MLHQAKNTEAVAILWQPLTLTAFVHDAMISDPCVCKQEFTFCNILTSKQRT